jgi:tripartite-type tricarboxylate transporter receptor subunit TctC
MKNIVTLLFLLLSWVDPTYSQSYPSKPVKVLLGFSPGSGPDIQAHTVLSQLSLLLNQNFLIENKVGANGTIAARTVAQSNPDGYTLLFSSSGIASTPYIYKNPGFDLLKDLKAISSAGILDGMLVLVNSKSSIKSVSDLIELAQKEHVMYGSPGVGNIIHLATEMFNQNAGVTLEHIPYKGTSDVMTGLLSNSIQVMFATPPSVLNLVLDGKVRPIAFTGSKRFSQLPDVPLLKDLVPGFQPIGSWGIFFAPAKTPPEILNKLNANIKEALKASAVVGVMQRDGYFPDNRSVEEINEFFKGEVLKLKDPIKAAKIDPI